MMAEETALSRTLFKHREYAIVEDERVVGCVATSRLRL